ncbi:hypothetical protein ACRALDRAFT_211667 [Sodiomyces alcalophilus JCM 7366]|uniref:uncharacterized protein n=1 Tax=Sodiomyces alcalophilus JCM 7366 TaxID=591952 RepID=UPI0039B4B4E1
MWANCNLLAAISTVPAAFYGHFTSKSDPEPERQCKVHSSDVQRTYVIMYYQTRISRTPHHLPPESADFLKTPYVIRSRPSYILLKNNEGAILGNIAEPCDPWVIEKVSRTTEYDVPNPTPLIISITTIQYTSSMFYHISTSGWLCHMMWGFMTTFVGCWMKHQQEHIINL